MINDGLNNLLHLYIVCMVSFTASADECSWLLWWEDIVVVLICFCEVLFGVTSCTKERRERERELKS